MLATTIVLAFRVPIVREIINGITESISESGMNRLVTFERSSRTEPFQLTFLPCVGHARGAYL